MKFIFAPIPAAVFFIVIFLFSNLSGTSQSALPSSGAASIFGFRNSSDEMAREIRFMVVPDPKLAEDHLRILTQAPHMAGTPEDKAPPTTWPKNFARPASTPRSSNTGSG